MNDARIDEDFNDMKKLFRRYFKAENDAERFRNQLAGQF